MSLESNLPAVAILGQKPEKLGGQKNASHCIRLICVDCFGSHATLLLP
jgi:hypothetical protein